MSQSRPLPAAVIPLLGPHDDTTELVNMLHGRPYIAKDDVIYRLQTRGFALLDRIERVVDMDHRMEMYDDFLDFFPPRREGKGVWISRGFLCEYGFNILMGEDIYVGPRCTFLDVAPIRIGSRTMIGANTQLYTPVHPLAPEARNGLSGPESALPITIGDDCWLGGGVVICPGVTMGDGCTIGAGAVVTKDVPARSVVVGNPGRVVKRIDKDGSVVDAS